MPAASVPVMGDPAPGEPVSSTSGSLTAVQHNGFPGVLLIVRVVGADQVAVERKAAGSRAPWVPVRTATPVMLESGVGHAYDAEALPNCAYLYRLVFEGDASTAHQVLVQMEPWAGSCEAWLKHLARPDLSRRVRVMVPWEPSRGAYVAAEDVWGVGAATVEGWGTPGQTGSLTLRTEDEDAWRAVEAALRTPGVLLLQCSPDHGVDPLYLVRTGVQHGRPGDLPGWRLREHVASFMERDRPTDFDQPPVVPGWTYVDHADGRSLDDVARQYGDETALLIAGVQQWNPGRAGAA